MDNNNTPKDKFNSTENHLDYICSLQKDFLQQINRIDIELIYIIKLDNAKEKSYPNDIIGNILSKYKKLNLIKKLISLKERYEERSLQLYISYVRYKKAILSILVLVFIITLLWANFICYALYAIILLLLYIPIMQNGEKMKYIIVLHIGHNRIATRYSKNENNTNIQEITGLEKTTIITKANKLSLNYHILDSISNAECSYIQEVNKSIYNPNTSKNKITLLIHKNNQYEKINIDSLSSMD